MDVFLTGFSKKPFVAIYLIIIIIMCISMSEAAPHRRHEHRRRLRKTNTETEIAKERHVHRYNLDNSRKKDSQIEKESFSKATKEVKIYLNYALHEFSARRRQFEQPFPRPRGFNAEWVPKVNFVDIHKNRTSHKMGVIKSFKYLSRRLQKHLLQYRIVFTNLLEVDLHHTSLSYDYIHNRYKLISDTIDTLSGLMTKVNDAMDSVKMPRKEIVQPKTLRKFCSSPGNTLNGIQDHIAFRAYENFLNNWNNELECPTHSKSKRCQKYKNELYKRQSKKVSRRKRNSMVKRELNQTKKVCYDSAWTKRSANYYKAVLGFN